jgi:hypothetical protein
MLEILKIFSTIPWYSLAIFFAGLISLVILIPIMISYFVKKTHTNKLGPIEFDNEEDSILNQPQIRDYRMNVMLAFGYVKDDLRYRIRSNGFNKIKDWDNYITEAVISFDVIIKNYMDLNYYSKAIIDRLTLTEQNKIIVEEVKDKYAEMFNNILDIMKEEKENIKKLEEELDGYKKGVFPIVLSDILYLVHKIYVIESETITRRGMVEVERALAEITQMYFKHYVKIYKEEISKK